MNKTILAFMTAAALLCAAAAGCAETAAPTPTPALAMESHVATPTATPAPGALVMEPNVAPKPTAEPNVTAMAFHEMRLSPEGFNVAITNPEANEGLFYIAYTMSIKETGEVLFETGMLAPGEVCQTLTFSRRLEPGEYDTVVLVQPYRMSDKTPTNNAMLEVRLIVEE